MSQRNLLTKQTSGSKIIESHPLEGLEAEFEDLRVEEVQDDSDDDTDNKYQYKVIIVGDGTVGKTSTIRRFTEDEFQQSYVRTVGVDWFIKNVSIVAEIPQVTNTESEESQKKTKKIEVCFQIWDVEGQSLGSKLLSSYIYGSDAVILTYDITNSDSFKNLEEWLKYVKHIFSDSYEGRKSAEKSKDPVICIFANKCDLSHERKVKRETHDEWAGYHKLSSFFVSAKTGDMVNLSFIKLAAMLVGVQLPQGQLEGATKVIVAPIINYSADDKSETESVQKSKVVKSRTCCIS